MKKANTKRLLKTDFCDRLLGFAEKYDEVRGTSSYDNIKKWINENNFDSIKYFLDTYPVEYFLPVTMQQFVTMSYEEFLCLQSVYLEVSALIDEKKALYQELISFCE